jgi:hypothetical protein
MRVGSYAFVITLAMITATVTADSQGRGGRSYVEALVPNVAHVRAGDRTGFGFIVGLGDGQLVIATALHTLEGEGGDAPTICFPHRGETCSSGSILYIADAIGGLPALDLVFLTVPYPHGLSWRPDVMAESARLGVTVWSVGRGREWFVPEEPGTVTGMDRPKQLVMYKGLSVAEGVSGAPIVSDEGIVSMHVQSLGDDGAQGIELSAIRERLVDHARGRWILVPRADCQQFSMHRAALGGSAITLHFDADVFDAAMQATARLHCLGMRVTLRPVWDRGEWPGDRIIYRSGDVRLMRSLQSVLASFGRLDAVLGQPAGAGEVWIR